MQLHAARYELIQVNSPVLVGIKKHTQSPAPQNDGLIKISPCENPNSHGELQYKQTAPKTEPSIQMKKCRIKWKHHLEPLSAALKRLVEPFNVKPLRLNIEIIYSETSAPLCSTWIWNLCVEPFNLDVEPWSETYMWNLWAESFCEACEAFIQYLHDKPFCETFMWNLSLEPWNLYSWNLGTCKSGTWNVESLGELELLRVEPLCGPLGSKATASLGPTKKRINWDHVYARQCRDTTFRKCPGHLGDTHL